MSCLWRVSTLTFVLFLLLKYNTSSPLGDAQYYLSKYEYLATEKVDSVMKTSNLMDRSTLADAIKQFQKFAGLPQTGEADERTLRKMHEPRCGVSDIKSNNMRRYKRYTSLGTKWEKNDVTYKIVNYTRQRISKTYIDYWIEQAFNVWMRVTPLKFRRVYSRKADIEIVFGDYSHGDGYPFDGEGGTLAHAFQPGNGLAGDAHFDDSETWIFRDPNIRGSDLFSVAVHEFGHSLGLGHSNQAGSIMGAFYQYVQDVNDVLSPDDIKGIQSLYGANTVSPNPIPPKPTTTLKPKITPTPRPAPGFCRKVIQFDAMVSTSSGKTYAFVGSRYVYIWNKHGLESTSPKRTSAVFKGLHWGVNAAFTLKFGGREMIYVLYVWFVWIYDAKTLEIIKEQIPMREIFPDLPYTVDAAFEWSKDGNLYIFKGRKYWKMNHIQDDFFKIATGYPQSITDWNLPNTKLSAALSWSNNGRTYFFSRHKYYKYDDTARKVEPGYPRELKQWWLHCPNANGLVEREGDSTGGVQISATIANLALAMGSIITVIFNLH